MNLRAGKSTFGSLLLVLILAAGAALAAYFLYLRTPSDDSSPRVAARTAPETDDTTVSPTLKHQFTPEEKQALESAAQPPRTAAPPEPETSAASDAASSAVPQPPTPAEPTASDAAAAVATDEPKPAPPVTEGTPPASGPDTVAASPAPETTSPIPAPEAIAPSAPPVAATASPVAKPRTAKPKSGEVWAVNALSTQDGVKARELLDELMKLPYHVYAYQKEIKGRNWYRIRIGFFSSRDEADKVGVDLARRYNLPPPWIVRPGKQELDKYYRP